MVAHKIMDVADATCRGCPQNWQGECRAYEVPHSPEEGNQRKAGSMNCQPEVSEFSWRVRDGKRR